MFCYYLWFYCIIPFCKLSFYKSIQVYFGSCNLGAGSNLVALMLLSSQAFLSFLLLFSCGNIHNVSSGVIYWLHANWCDFFFLKGLGGFLLLIPLLPTFALKQPHHLFNNRKGRTSCNLPILLWKESQLSYTRSLKRSPVPVNSNCLGI